MTGLQIGELGFASNQELQDALRLHRQAEDPAVKASAREFARWHLENRVECVRRRNLRAMFGPEAVRQDRGIYNALMSAENQQ